MIGSIGYPGAEVKIGVGDSDDRVRSRSGQGFFQTAGIGKDSVVPFLCDGVSRKGFPRAVWSALTGEVGVDGVAEIANTGRGRAAYGLLTT